MAVGVDVERIDVARALASDPRKALPLLFAASVGAIAGIETVKAKKKRKAKGTGPATAPKRTRVGDAS